MSWYEYKPADKPLYQTPPPSTNNMARALICGGVVSAAILLLAGIAAIFVIDPMAGAAVVAIWVCYFIFRSAT